MSCLVIYLGCTSVVSQTLKPLCTLSDVAAVTVSSSSSRKSSPRWQFWRRSQPPSVMLLANSLRAWTSWPCPMEMGRHGAPCRQRAHLCHSSILCFTSIHFQSDTPSRHLWLLYNDSCQFSFTKRLSGLLKAVLLWYFPLSIPSVCHFWIFF